MARKGRARPQRKRVPDLGRLDVCLSVADFRRSAAFYEKLGFREVEGDRRKGWAVFERGGARVGLYHGFIKTNMLNFRGGDVPAVVRAMEAAGLHPYEVKFVGREGAGSARVKDPDHNVILFDTALEERRARKRKVRGRR